MSYCQYVETPTADILHKKYHDERYGFPISDDAELFGRLLLEINQAGLNWLTMLKKEEGFRNAYSGFDIDKVANYTEKDFERLMNDASIIRNRLKINATIHNAQQIVALKKQHGSFKNWLDAHHPKSKEEWVVLFKKNFKFTGGEIVGEFLMSTGYLGGAHSEDCVIYQKLKPLKPPFLNSA